MTLFQLKIVAVSAMIIDHIGILFFPQFLWLRWIGRLAFPIFAWTIANGYHYTHSVYRYAVRLLVFATLSQVPFLLFHYAAGGAYPHMFNIFFTLAYGLGDIALYEKTYHASQFGWVPTVVAIKGSMILPLEYGLYGVVAILLFHITFGKKRDTYIVQILWIVFALSIRTSITGLHLGFVMHALHAVSATQLISLASLPLIYMYTNMPGSVKYKQWFYWFYPVHLTLLFALNRFL